MSEERGRKHRAHLMLTLSMVLVGSSIVAGKLLVQELPINFASALRYGLAFAILAVCLRRAEGRFPRIGASTALALFAQALMGVFLFSLCLLHGLRFTSALDSGIITSATPAVIALLASFFLAERLRARQWLGIGLATAGVLVINVAASSGGADFAPAPLKGNLLIVVAVVGEALFTILGKATGRRLSPLAIATYVSLLGFLMFLGPAVVDLRTLELAEVSLEGWLLVVYFAVFVTVFAFVLWYSGLRSVPAATAAGFTAVLPVSTVVLSYLILGSSLGLRHVAGTMLILGGLAFIVGRALPRPAAVAQGSAS